ncbi:hypothetical protein [Pseudoxanthomonas yeongjuensis]|uniref:hypothetical protein n=1 Tax=Pseudoxanthomonas yeongjuensis TaxID=377616 RepID=UPI001391FAD4|nr:hypothetical protein [Pseudoxanthomonas yeongjuensis]
MKRLVFSPLLLGLAFAAVAQTPAPIPVETAAPQTSTVPASDAARPASKDEVTRKDDVAKKDEVSDRSCLKETGSRLAPRPDNKGRKCVNATGRSYTKDDLDRTGAIDLSDALRRLDPAVH